MGRSDVVVNRYFSVPEHFSDFVNGVLFDGKQILQPENLYEKGENLRESIPGKSKKVYLGKSRDVIMKADFHGVYSILAVETQEETHYGMPVRVMLYDALEYSRQIQSIKRQHETGKDFRTSAEFLSKMKKDDRLIPVITLIFYYGESPWDGSKNLRELFLIPKELEELEEYMPDYPIHVISPENIDPNVFQSEWKEIFELLKRRKDGQELLEYAKNNQDKLQGWDMETKELTMILMKGKQVWEEMEEKENMDMCEAFRQLKEMGREEGMRYKLTELIQRKLAKGKTIEQIAADLEEPLEVIAEIVETL